MVCGRFKLHAAGERSLVFSAAKLETLACIEVSLLFFCFVFLPWVFIHSRVTLACLVTMDLVVGVNVTTSTIIQGMRGIQRQP